MAFRDTQLSGAGQDAESSERRQTIRYPLPLELEFAMIGAGEVTTGTGTVIDISSSGVRFSVAVPPPEEKLISLSLRWPVKRAGSMPLKLLVWGQVRRRVANEIVVRFRKYEIHGLAELNSAAGPFYNWRLGAASARRLHADSPAAAAGDSQGTELAPGTREKD